MKQLTKYTCLAFGLCVFSSHAFGQSGLISSGTVAVSASKDVMANVQGAYYESARVMRFDVYEQNNEIFCDFKTEFSCHSYTIEGKQSRFDEFKSLFYCHEDSCVDTKSRISVSFTAGAKPCRYYRLKTVLANGEIHYSQSASVDIKEANEVEITNPVVGSLLNLKFNVTGVIPDYRYTIEGMNGEVVRDENLKGNAVDLQVLPAGVYFISFNSSNGNYYHYKIIRTADL